MTTSESSSLPTPRRSSPLPPPVHVERVGDEHERRLLIRQSLPPRQNPYESLRVCGRCFRLFGGEGLQRRLCACTPLAERGEFCDAVTEATGSAWHKHYELCRCCASGIVSANDRYARWFCAFCLKQADFVNRACGYCAIPVGGHSIVNGVYGSAKSCKTRAGATALADQLSAFFADSGSVWDWGILITERQWRHAGLPINEVVTADAYLEAVLAKGLDPEVLFKELAIARGVPIHCLPQQRIDIPLNATWRLAEPPSDFAATEMILWEYPDGEIEYAPLRLLVSGNRREGWTWSVSVDELAAGSDDPVLATGRTEQPAIAKEQCEEAALQQIYRQENRFGSESAEPLPGAETREPNDA